MKTKLNLIKSMLIALFAIICSISVFFGVSHTTASAEENKDVSAVSVGEDCFLEVNVVKKVGGTWTIRIKNTNSYMVEAYYNTKMCFEGDAKNWTLSDVVCKNIAANSSTNVQISENFWAGYIAVAWASSGDDKTTYITYANNLNASTHSLTAYYVAYDHNILS